MKKHLTLLALACLLVTNAFAQQSEAQKKDYTKFELQITGGSGLSTLLYDVPVDGQWMKWLHQTDQYQAAHFDLNDMKSSSILKSGWNAGFGFTYNFSPNWGLVTGLEVAHYRGEVFAKEMISAQYISVPSVLTGQNIPGLLFNRLSRFDETQSVYNLQLPIMFRWMPGAGDKVRFYLAAGVKLGYGISATFKQTTSRLEYLYSVPGTVYHEQTNAGKLQLPFSKNQWTASGHYHYVSPGDVDAIMAGTKEVKDALLDPNVEAQGNFSFGFNTAAALELGAYWHVNDLIRLYTGVYADYGFYIARSQDGALYQNDLSWNDNWYNDFRPYDSSKEKTVSVLTANNPAYARRHNDDKDGAWEMYPEEGNLVNKLAYLSCGLKVRLSFALDSKPAPAPQPVVQYVERIVRDTMKVVNTVIQKDTVVNTVIQKDTVTVRDTVTVIKEVPVEIQKVMADLSNSLFDTGKAIIKDQAKGPLYTVVMWLKENPNAKVEVSGHTDNVGGAAYNKKLSEARAKAVYDYFIANGVSADRLSYAGYGMDRPIAPNDTPEGRQQNRRVELNVIE